ncbi:MAG: hypothetical protein ABSB75_07260 [Candidatus Limnocylindrales bacterium]
MTVAGAVVLGLAVSAGQLTAASLTAGGTDTAQVQAARAGQPVTTGTVLYADSSPAVFARAASARDAFGFPAGVKRTGRHVHDGFQRSEYDEVSEVDAAGRSVSTIQLDGDGRVLAAIRFDPDSSEFPKTTSDGAAESAERGLTASGVRPGGQPTTETNSSSGGWDVHWRRTEGGYAVRGDEVRVHVRHDGRIGSVARIEHRLAAAPARRLNQSEARQAVTRQMNAWFSGRGSGYDVQGMDLQWVDANAAFDPSKLGAAPQPYRLAWVANVKPSGPAAESVRLITLYVDAGDGTVIGGDVVE